MVHELDLESFKASLANSDPPQGLSPALEALWWDAKGDWDKAHALVMDDSTDQVGLRLQTTQHQTQLNLGHIKRQRDNERTQSHGHGVELITSAYGALLAGQGLLISADARPNARARHRCRKRPTAKHPRQSDRFRRSRRSMATPSRRLPRSSKYEECRR